MKRRTFILSAVAGAAAAIAIPQQAGASTLGRAPASGTVPMLPGRGPYSYVASLEELQAAIASATPEASGTIIVANGTYAVPEGAAIDLAGVGGRWNKPLTIMAESVGGVTLTGARSFAFDATHDVAISGFVFTQSTTLEIPANCRAITLSRNEFVLADIEGMHCVMVRADDTVVEYNHFHGKSTLGIFLGIEGGGSTEMAENVHIHHNHFSDHTFAGANGGEPIRLGVSPRALSSAHAVVEYNLFERTNGDPEAISVKSSDNVIRFNTIRDSGGGIVLRHGNRTTVESNHIIRGERGIRIYGNDHLIVNNYIGETADTALVLGAGTLKDHYEGEPANSRNKNDAADRVRIALNTIVGNAGGISGETHRPIAPTDCVIVDNIFQGEEGILAKVPVSSGFTWAGNILWGAAPDGDIPADGFTRVDPQLTRDGADVLRIGATSPAIDAATQDHAAYARDDIEGRRRAGIADVGAHEFGAGLARREPLTTADVGPFAP
ncbi:polysaccharide lyase 6 family protein [Microbacterium sp. SD291]|uniref:polysaccharide lyase 6 family protein n=1 Tax=Microbacterium sp. SD291 TaxID=2782007 RepID=UPI001A958C3B|nr:polysaccharide lyase 6 family protein [Microbacterium sp. SD291]MBO0979726.1 polysaccharide lyase 6 family protein [Microbacterium sp. SD291]